MTANILPPQGITEDKYGDRSIPRHKLKFQEELFTDQFGIKDDSTDQTDRLLSAMEAAVGENKRLVIVPGTYLITDITAPDNLLLRGFGKLSILKRSDNSTAHILVPGDNNVIEDLSLDGNLAIAGATGSGALTILSGTDDVTLRRLYVYNIHAHGIRTVASDNIMIDDCRVVSTTDDGSGIVYHGGGGGGIHYNYTVKNCRVNKSGAADGSGIGTALNQAGDNVLRGCEIAHNYVYGASGAICIETFAGGTGDFISDMILSKNRTFGGTMGISVPFINGGTIEGNVDRWDGTLPGTGSWGIELIGCENTTCTGNSVYGRDVGITLNSGSHNVVANNTLKDIGVVNSDLSSFAIAMSDAVSQPEANLIEGNIIDGCLGNGITVRGDAGGFIVGHNIIDGVTGDAAIQYGGTGGTSGDVNCSNNTIRNSTVGIRFEGAVTFGGVCKDNNMRDGVTTPIQTAGGADITGVNFRDNPPASNHRAKVTRASNQLSSNGVAITVLFTSEVYDVGNMVDLAVDASEVVIQEQGLYACAGVISWASNASGRRIALIQHTTPAAVVTSHGATGQMADTVGSHNQTTGYVEIYCQPGDKIELVANYGGVGAPATLNITAGTLTVRRVG